MKKQPASSPRSKSPKNRTAPKKKYRVRNWSEYNQALVNRGSLDIWISEAAMQKWYAAPSHEPGRQQTYSDLAIASTLTVKKLFRLPLRATEGFLSSVFTRACIDLRVPDYSTLSRREESARIRVPKQRKGKVVLVIDASGLKVCGEGEWKVRQHGKDKRRTWKKLHVGIDADGEVRAHALTGSNTHDGKMAPSLMGSERNAVALVGDGAYDDWFIYALCEGNGIPDVRIPPKKGAVIWRHGNTRGGKEARDENLRTIRKKGKKAWKEESGYHVRSKVENFFFRLKTVFGDRLSARTAGRQQTEAALMCAALNRMMALGMPESYAVQTAHP